MVIDIEESKKQGTTVYRDTVVQPKEEPKKAEKKSKKSDDSETISFRDED